MKLLRHSNRIETHQETKNANKVRDVKSCLTLIRGKVPSWHSNRKLKLLLLEKIIENKENNRIKKQIRFPDIIKRKEAPGRIDYRIKGCVLGVNDSEPHRQNV